MPRRKPSVIDHLTTALDHANTAYFALHEIDLRTLPPGQRTAIKEARELAARLSDKSYEAVVANDTAKAS